MPIKPWTLLAKKDVSPSMWFPIEQRTYQLPDGRVVDDFLVTTLADVAMIVPLTVDGKVVLVRQFKPGIGDVLLQFPAGRVEPNHRDIRQTARHELQEETGISIDETQLHDLAKVHAFSTKATEVVHLFVATECAFNAQQQFDEHEQIEVVQLSYAELDDKIMTGEFWDAEGIAAWELAKKKYPKFFTSHTPHTDR